MAWWIAWLADTQAALRLPIDHGKLRIGSGAYNDIVLRRSQIARRHIELSNDGRSIRAVDLSGEGFSLNGESCSETELKNGDRLKIGDIELGIERSVEEALELPDKFTRIDNRVAADIRREQGIPTWTLSWKGDDEDNQGTRIVDRAITIGVDEGCDIVLTDEFISQKHCQIDPFPGGLLVNDLRSTNGVWTGPIRLLECLMSDGATFSCGRVIFSVEGEPGEEIHIEKEDGMIGQHASVIALRRQLKRLAKLDETVLIQGETGTGKELAARMLHHHSDRREEPFVVLNCGSISSELIESELFGHVKGAFTGASKARDGAFKAAGKGTIFLDEIGELPQEAQVKLLRVLDGNGYTPVGSDKVEMPQARVVAATNRNLAMRVREGAFREDLFYRLNVLPVDIPALRHRRDDIPTLSYYFLRVVGATLDITQDALDALMSYSWPGNIRELRNVLVATVGLKENVIHQGYIDESDLVFTAQPDFDRWEDGELKISDSFPSRYSGESLKELEEEIIRDALDFFNGNKTLTARGLKISKTTLYEKLKRFGIET